MAIRSAHFAIACFSHQSVSKRGSFQCELRYAMLCATSIPLDEVFLIPVRLEPCAVPARIIRRLHYVNLFPSWELGFKKILKTMARQEKSKR
jgi:hypothetical protein